MEEREGHHGEGTSGCGTLKNWALSVVQEVSSGQHSTLHIFRMTIIFLAGSGTLN